MRICLRFSVLRPKAPEMQGAYVKTCIRFCPLAGQGCPFFWGFWKHTSSWHILTEYSSRKLNISPLKNDGTGRRSFPFFFGKVTFSGRTVKLEECTSSSFKWNREKGKLGWHGIVGGSKIMLQARLVPSQFLPSYSSFSVPRWRSLGFWCLKSYFCFLGPTWEVVVQGTRTEGNCWSMSLPSSN